MSPEHEFKLHAKKRTEFTRSSLRKLRESGQIPGVVYGGQNGSQSLYVDERDLIKVVRTGRTEFFQLNVENSDSLPVLIKDIQQQGGRVVHVDFQEVSRTKPIRVKMPIHLIGTAEGTKSGGILQVQETELEVEGMADQLPAAIEVDVTSLRTGDKLVAANVKLPEGVTLISSGDSLLASVVTTRATEVEEEEETAAAEPAAKPVEAKES